MQKVVFKQSTPKYMYGTSDKRSARGRVDFALGSDARHRLEVAPDLKATSRLVMSASLHSDACSGHSDQHLPR